MRVDRIFKGSLVCIDPGLRACGAALFVDGELVRAGAVRGPTVGRGPDVWAAYAGLVEGWVGDAAPGALLVEQMKVYVQGKGDPDDLLELAGIAGAIVGRLSGWTASGVRARDWNGQVPAPIRRARTQAWVQQCGWLDRVDLRTTARFQEDIWSAVGIGRWRTTQSR
jgi:hypothetical protein